jgi:hypothetical protein
MDRARRVATVNAAFEAGASPWGPGGTPDEIADRIIVVGTPEDWVRRLTETRAPAGLNHALGSFTDPFTLSAWAEVEVEGLPDPGQRLRIYSERVLPEINSLRPQACVTSSAGQHLGGHRPRFRVTRRA